MKIGNFKWLIFLELFFLFSSRVVFAQSIFGSFDPIKFVFGPDVPSEWYQVNMFMQWLVFPFIGIWLVLFGILEQLGIFRARRSIGAFLALIMAFIGASSGFEVMMARVLFQLMGGWGLLVFFAVFMLGALFWGWGEIHGRWKAKDYAKEFDNNIKSIDTKIDQLNLEWTNAVNAGNSNKANDILKKIDQLNGQKIQMEKAFRERFAG